MKTVLIVSHELLWPTNTGFRTRVVRMMRWLRGQGFRVVLLAKVDATPPHLASLFAGDCDEVITVNADSSRGWFLDTRRRVWMILRPLLARLRRQQQTVPAQPGEVRPPTSAEVRAAVFPHWMLDHFRRVAGRVRPDVVICEYVYMTGVFAHCPPGVLKIVDTIDVMSSRAEKIGALGVQDPMGCSREEEAALLRPADVVIAIQSEEARLLRNLSPSSNVITVGMDCPTAAAIPVDRPGAAPSVLVVGSDNASNLKGLSGFLEKAWPLIRASHPDATLRLVGNIARAVAGTPPPGVDCAGFVGDLAREYASATLVINPVFAGTGLKIKTVEALCHGAALVTFPTGVEGIDLGTGPAPWRCAETWDRFAENCSTLLGDASARTAQRHLALDFARASFSPESVYAPLLKVLTSGQ